MATEMSAAAGAAPLEPPGRRVDAVDLLGPRGEEDHRRVGEGAEAAEDLDAVETRQHDVEDDHVGGEGSCLLDGRRPVRGLDHEHPLAFEEAPHDAADRGLVIDDENADRARWAGHALLTRTTPGSAGPAPWYPRHPAVQLTTTIVPFMPAS